ncbi:MAG TPA: DNA sulfur modification protein DndD [Candidatus Paceibacterota bacterium]|nr:DNA sulfur modification protein DndD [Verrucomicrobiota bacterium]HRY51565.1 DNA sulfur modification protein DndD [Candidatus Paceibacterota bacterium]
MILESLVINNFGVYRGRQEAVLAPVDERKPIVLFGGLNGGGKTTLLDAVQLALYGQKARCAGRGRLAYRDYLRAMINRDADPAEGAAIELRFRRAVDGEMKYYRVTRSWRDTPRDIVDRMEVHTDAALDKELSEHWDEFIEGYIPSGIAHLFFFDAEQIKELAEGEHAAEILGTAVHSLLGLDLVDRLETDLIVLERRKRAESRSAEETERIQQAQQELEQAQQLLEEARFARGARVNELERQAKEVELAEGRFRQEGGELYLTRKELEAERGRLKADLIHAEMDLRELSTGAAPLLLIPALLEETEALAREELEAHKAHVLASALEDRDSEVVVRLKKLKLPPPYLKTVVDLLTEDRRQRNAAKRNVVLADANGHLAAELRHLRTAVLPEVRRNIELKLETVASLQERLTRLDLELARVPTAEAIAGLQGDLERARKRWQERQGALAAQDEKIRLLERQVEDAERRLKRELGEGVESEVDREHVARVLKHSARMRDTLGKFRVAVIRKHTERLERLILEAFHHLLRKRSLVTGLVIDPTTFRIELTGGDRKPLPFERLSAGERQLLATSILWGLARASGRLLPTIIDTPLGRLDSSHRRHLLERYFPVASHQVILLSTDEEIDETSLHHLKRYVGRSYELRFEEQTRSTKINSGYFWDYETAR